MGLFGKDCSLRRLNIYLCEHGAVGRTAAGADANGNSQISTLVPKAWTCSALGERAEMQIPRERSMRQQYSM